MEFKGIERNPKDGNEGSWVRGFVGRSRVRVGELQVFGGKK